MLRMLDQFTSVSHGESRNEAFLIMFNSFVVGWETEWFVYNTESDPTIEAGDVT